MTAIVMFYAELGRPYLPLIEAMTASAKAVMPEATTILLTPTPSAKLARLFDRMFIMPVDATWENLCLERARCMVSWQCQSTERTIYVDPDVVFKRPVEFGNFDVGVAWRSTKPDQPVNTGLILAEPGSHDFWKHYGSIVGNLPPVLRSWWCDQLGFSILLGAAHKAGETLLVDEARVKLFDVNLICPKLENVTEASWTAHYKGSRKGDQWQEAYALGTASGVGRSFPACASSTDIAREQSLASAPASSPRISAVT